MEPFAVLPPCEGSAEGCDAMADLPDDDDVDLGISLETVATVVLMARALQGTEEPDSAEALEDADSEAALLQENPDDVTDDALKLFINELNEDEQSALVALAWTGRGDYGPEDWDEALRLATERNEGQDAAAYLLNMDMVGDLLAEGVAAFGLSIEDIET